MFPCVLLNPRPSTFCIKQERYGTSPLSNQKKLLIWRYIALYFQKLQSFSFQLSLVDQRTQSLWYPQNPNPSLSLRVFLMFLTPLSFLIFLLVTHFAWPVLRQRLFGKEAMPAPFMRYTDNGIKQGRIPWTNKVVFCATSINHKKALKCTPS